MKTDIRRILSAECWLGKRFDIVIIHHTIKQLLNFSKDIRIEDFPLYTKLSDIRRPPYLKGEDILFNINVIHGLNSMKQYVKLFTTKEPVDVIRFDKIHKVTIDNYPIKTDKEFRLINGSHRMASAIFSNLKEIEFESTSGVVPAGYGYQKEWVEEHFNNKELDVIYKEWMRIKRKLGVQEKHE